MLGGCAADSRYVERPGGLDRPLSTAFAAVTASGQTSGTMADDAAKKRTFRKFTFRGVDLDQLLDMNSDELIELFHARARRR